jgi:hypothetical protein
MEKCCDAVVTGNTISGRVFWRHGVPEFKRHRLPLTGSRWDKRWLIGRRTKPTFCVFSVLNVAVMERGCDACRDWEYYFRSGFSVSGGAGVSEGAYRLLLTGSRCYKQWLIDRRTKPTFCVFPVFSVAVMERGCDACRDGEYYFRSVFSVSNGAGVSWASTAVEPEVNETYDG